MSASLAAPGGDAGENRYFDIYDTRLLRDNELVSMKTEIQVEGVPPGTLEEGITHNDIIARHSMNQK